MCKNDTSAKFIFPNEQFVDASSLNFNQKGPEYEVPKNLENIKVAKSRITPTKGKSHISDNDAKTLAKELRQARILTSRGLAVYLIPKTKDARGREVPSPDAIVNGTLYEFKTVTGSIRRVETNYRQSRDQGQNVFIRVMNPNISKSDVIRKMYSVINDRKYTGGFKGNFIFSVRQGSSEKLYYIKIKDLKK
jgi:hypothetical protein